MTEGYETLKSKIEQKRKLIAKHSADLASLLKACTHEELETRTSYFEGSYYDRASTDTWEQCKLCGKRFNERTKDPSWYG